MKKIYKNNVMKLFVYTLVISFCAGLAGASPSLSISPSETISIEAGETIEVTLSVDELPDGLSGYNLTVSIDDPTVAEIVSIDYPSWTTIEETTSLPGTSIYIKVVDTSHQVESGATDIELATLTLEGVDGGSTDISVTVSRFDDDEGDESELENTEKKDGDSSSSSKSSSSSSSSSGISSSSANVEENGEVAENLEDEVVDEPMESVVDEPVSDESNQIETVTPTEASSNLSNLTIIGSLSVLLIVGIVGFTIYRKRS